MFDIGFFELALVGVVALLVVGPERLPKLARTLGIWVGRARRFAESVKEDVQREMRQQEIREAFGKTEDLKDVYDIVEETRSDVADAGRDAAAGPKADDTPQASGGGDDKTASDERPKPT